MCEFSIARRAPISKKEFSCNCLGEGQGRNLRAVRRANSVRAKGWPAVPMWRLRMSARGHCRSLSILAAIVVLLAAMGSVRADQAPSLPRDDFGGVGLIEMPSARMAPDGELS